MDTEAFDRDRLLKDGIAMSAMKVVAQAVVENRDEAEKPGAWKWAIRKKMWDHLEANDIAEYPRPVHHRIPNFKGAEAAARMLATLPQFQEGKIIKVNPDTPQKAVRLATLSAGKGLLTPQPRLRTGFFSILTKDTLPPGTDALREACTSAGVAKYGAPLGLDAKLKVDMVVVGSVAVCPKTGARLGKGEGFAELEYGMLRMMGAIDETTLIVTSIHDCQVLEMDEIDTSKLLLHDVPVDVICTPTRIIYTKTKIPKPTGIYWHLLSPQKLAQIKVLQQLKAQIEAETGQKLPSGPDEALPPLAARGKGTGAGGGNARRGGRRGRGSRDRQLNGRGSTSTDGMGQARS